MDKLIEILQTLVPAWIAFFAIAFGYLVYLFKKTSDRFININEKQAEYLKDRVEIVDKASGILTRAIEQQEKEIEKLTSRLNTLGGKFDNARTDNAERSAREVETISATMQEILELQGFLLKSQERTNSNIEEINALQESIRHRLTSELPKAIRSRDLSAYPIFLTNLPEVDILMNALRQNGYKADIYDESLYSGIPNEQEYKPKDHEAIWLGSKIPAMVAIQAIKIAKEHWPFLKYVHISSDTFGELEPELYFGGSTTTALEYNLKPWSQANFDKLDIAMTDNEFTNYVKNLYSYNTPNS